MLSVTQPLSDPGVVLVNRDGDGRILITTASDELMVQVRDGEDRVLERGHVPFPDQFPIEKMKTVVDTAYSGDRVDIRIGTPSGMRSLAELRIVCNEQTDYGIWLMGRTTHKLGNAWDVTIPAEDFSAIAPAEHPRPA